MRCFNFIVYLEEFCVSWWGLGSGENLHTHFRPFSNTYFDKNSFVYFLISGYTCIKVNTQTTSNKIRFMPKPWEPLDLVCRLEMNLWWICSEFPLAAEDSKSPHTPGHNTMYNVKSLCTNFYDIKCWSKLHHVLKSKTNLTTPRQFPSEFTRIFYNGLLPRFFLESVALDFSHMSYTLALQLQSSFRSKVTSVGLGIPRKTHLGIVFKFF